MVTRLATIGVAWFALLLASGAECQNVRLSFPDAPSARVATRSQTFRRFVEEVRSPLKAQGGFAAAREAEFRQQWPGTVRLDILRSSNTRTYGTDTNNIFRKYLAPSSARQAAGDHGAESGGLMSRGAHAALSMIIMRDDSGKIRLNTPYLLRTLTYVAKDTASTPYWRRYRADPVSDFGATVGDNAGMNVLHEFAPGIEQLMKSHAPRFVSKIEKRVGQK